jgi:alkylated DNA repair dioxygenase AlkB
MAIVTITFGDCAENHVGMQKIGQVAEEGLELADLLSAKATYEAQGFVCEMVDLVALGGETVQLIEPDPAWVLIVRQPLNHTGLTADGLLGQLTALEWDSKALMYGRVVNKHARHNLCFSDEAQEPDYPAGRGRVVAWESVPLLRGLRDTLPNVFGPKAAGLQAEGNLYYDHTKCGIGFHGDTERRIVIAIRLGATMPLHYQWYNDGEPVGDRIRLELHHGDLYAMSSKAVGYDWKNRSQMTLRHAAGAKKYLA